ncbi:MAG TPA: penicillin-binding protein 1C [Flavobacteriales bacterium]|nr:penicillin-binding protein 1C [Flavobacteriales bacterium]HRP80535.1 penicillin-binding protein 1C [Flavobacteriales bacterium]
MMSRACSWARAHPRSTALLAGVVLLTAWARWWPTAPLFDSPCSTVLLDRDGELLGATVAADGQWRFPQVDPVPARFATCLTQFEDRRFRRHWGIRPQSLVRAWRQNHAAGRIVSGGSTITMQVARLARGNRPRTYGEKLIEALLAMRIELRHGKEEILALFAGHAPFGGNVVGLDAAAWRYFGRPASHLSWSESATLAVLPNAPSAIYPGKGHEALLAKRNRLLDRLLAVQAIDSLEWSLAKEEPLPGRTRELPRRAPHLLATLHAQGHDGQLLHSSVGGSLQDRATEAADRYAARLRANEVYNAAALIVDVPTGEVLAYVGNLGTAGARHAGDVDIIRARRSTGSVLKPFLYADMLQSGELTPDMLLSDVPTRYGNFTPRNYDEQYSGAVPASGALARSLNVPMVRLLHQYGVERTLRTLRGMGLHSIDRSAEDYGLSLVVGGAESTLWELAGAYAGMGRVLNHYGRMGLPYRQGDIRPPHVLLQKTRPSDPIAPLQGPPVLSASAIHFTLKALREVARPAEEQGWNHFAGQQHISWKTGTSFGHRDAWAIGLTSRYCIAVWTGNASGEGRPGLTGTLAAAPLLFDLFNLLPHAPPFEPPYDEMARAAICPASGYRAGIDCPRADTLWVPPTSLRTPTCAFHCRVLLDPSGQYRINEGDGHMATWFVLPPGMEHYYALGHPGYRPLPPWAPGTMGTDEPMEILYPEPGARLLIPVQLDGTRGHMVVEVAHRNADAMLFWDLDGAFIGTTTGIHRMALSPPEGAHRITLTDGQGHALHRNFTIVSGANSPPATHVP